MNITDKIKRVFDTTLIMILENGVQSASMGKISRASGVAVGTIYHHFASKEELVTELYRYHKMNMLKSFVSIKAGESIKETFYIFIKTFIEYGIKNPNEFEFVERFYKSPIINKAVMNEIESIMFKDNPLVDGFLSENHIFKDMSMQSISLFLNGAMVHTIRAHLSGEINMTDKDWNCFIDMLWDGITK